MPAEEDAQAILHNALRRIAGDKTLSPLLHELLDRTGICAPSPTPFTEGRRDIGLWLLREMDDADPGIYIRLCGERAKDEIQRRLDEAKKP